MIKKHPYLGQIVYYGRDGDMAQIVVRIEGDIIWTVPLGTIVRCTHQGNVYNADGESEWA